jgi:hypothetical protein
MATDSIPNPAFFAWLREVNQLCFLRFGLTLSDLPDLRTRDAFDNDVSPVDFMAEDVLPMLREEFGGLVDEH